MFRNGIYGECASLTTYELDNSNISPATINELNSSSLSAKNLSNGPSLLSSSVIVSTYEEYLSPITLYGSQSSICSIWPTSDIKIGYINTNDSSIPNNCAGLFNNISGADIMGNYEKEFISILAVKGSTSNAYIKLHTDTDSNTSSIITTANVITINSLENITLNTDNSVVIPLDGSLIDRDDFQSEQDCLIIGNTRNDNSGALIIKASYGYDTDMSIEDTIPITSVCSLTSQLKDENSDELSTCEISFECYSSESVISIECDRCDISGDADITGDITTHGTFIGNLTGNLNGCIPSANNYNTIPVGAIAMIAIHSTSSWPAVGATYPGKILVGDNLTATGGTIHNNTYDALYASQIYINSDDTISLYSYNGNNRISSGTFKAITMCANNKSGNAYLYCLAMRVE
jgi:hypothetical protein